MAIKGMTTNATRRPIWSQSYIVLRLPRLEKNHWMSHFRNPNTFYSIQNARTNVSSVVDLLFIMKSWKRRPSIVVIEECSCRGLKETLLCEVHLTRGYTMITQINPRVYTARSIGGTLHLEFSSVYINRLQLTVEKCDMSKMKRVPFHWLQGALLIVKWSPSYIKDTT